MSQETDPAKKKSGKGEVIISLSPFIVAMICGNLFPELKFLVFIFVGIGIILVIKYKPHLHASTQYKNENTKSTWEEDDRELEDL